MNKEKEIETVTLMVRRYCCGVHWTRGEVLCPACHALLEYARERRDRCLHGSTVLAFTTGRIILYISSYAARSFRIKWS